MKKYNELLKYDLFPYQVEGLDFALKHHYSICADQMGLGKTLQAIALAEYTKSKTLIICPAYLRRNWEAELNKFVKRDIKVRIILSESEALNNEDFDYAIMGYSQLKYAYKLFSKVDLVLSDEIHYLKNPKAQRTNMFHQLLEGARPKRFMGLTGSPIKNRVPEFYSLLCLCNYNIHKTSGHVVNMSYYKFQEIFCFVSLQHIGGGRKVKKFHGLKNKDLLKKFLHNKFIRRLAANVLDLKEGIYLEHIVTVKEDKVLQDAFENKDKEVYARAKMLSAVNKAKFTAQYAVGIKEQVDTPIVIFSEHPDAVANIRSHLEYQKYRVGSFDGGVNADKRFAIVENFQNGYLDFIIMTIGAGSTGFNLHAAKDLIFNDESPVPENNAQARKRIDRIGQTGVPRFHNVYASKTDRSISKLLRAKEKDLDEAFQLL